MDERHGGLGRGVGEVAVEGAQLRGDEHALVDDGAAAHGADVEDLAGERARRGRLLLDGAAADVEPALELVVRLDALGAAEEGLQDGGHAGAGGLAQVVRVHRHLAPEEQPQAALGAAVLEDGARLAHALCVLREEELGDAVVALVGEQVPPALGLLAEEAVGQLDQDARAVARVVLEPLAAAVVQVHQDGQRVVDHLVRADAAQVREGADAARVVLELGAVEPLRGPGPLDGRRRPPSACGSPCLGSRGSCGSGRSAHAAVLVLCHVSIPLSMRRASAPCARARFRMSAFADESHSVYVRRRTARKPKQLVFLPSRP